MKHSITDEIKDTMRTIPGLVTALFILSCVVMNLLACKSIFNLPWLASTAGVFVSWISFLCMDAVCKRFGSRASTILNTFAMLITLLTSLLMMLIVKIPGVWAASYAGATEEISAAINSGLDATFSSAWYIVIGSAAAMFLGGLTNSVVNRAVGSKVDKKGNYIGFALRSFASTAAGQFVDNFVFALFVSHIFFGWTMKQVVVCSFLMMLVELAFEIVFSPVGYHIANTWKRENVGNAYIEKYSVEA